jgi:hypothetical protein
METLVCCWEVSRDDACPTRAASGGVLSSSDVSDSDGTSCCCVCLCVFFSSLCVSQCLYNAQVFTGLICWLW